MESESTAIESIRELRRAELVAHTRYPRLGWWYPPTVGALAAGWVACWSLSAGWRSVGFLAFAVVVGAGAGAYIRRRGVNPRIRSAPPELRREMRWFLLAFAAIAAVVGVIAAATSGLVAAGLAFGLVTVFIARYEQRYARAAAAAEANSGLFADRP